MALPDANIFSAVRSLSHDLLPPNPTAKGFRTVLEINTDVGSVLMEHLSIRKHLRIISHRYRRFISGSSILITMSLFTSLLVATRPNADIGPFSTGEIPLCSITLVAGLMIILRTAAKITHKTQAVIRLASKCHVCATIDSFNLSETETPAAHNIHHPFSVLHQQSTISTILSLLLVPGIPVKMKLVTRKIR